MATSRKTTRASIWAQDKNGVLGDGKKMLWRVPSDFKFFKASTLGCPIIMGRTSYEAIGSALPGRLNIVLTRNPSLHLPDAEVASTLEEALSIAEREASAASAETIWIAGGGQIYDLAMDIVDELVISQLDFEVHDDGNETIRAPRIDPEIWKLDTDRSDPTWRPKSGDAAWRLKVYRRR